MSHWDKLCEIAERSFSHRWIVLVRRNFNGSIRVEALSMMGDQLFAEQRTLDEACSEILHTMDKLGFI